MSHHNLLCDIPVIQVDLYLHMLTYANRPLLETLELGLMNLTWLFNFVCARQETSEIRLLVAAAYQQN